MGRHFIPKLKKNPKSPMLKMFFRETREYLLSITNSYYGTSDNANHLVFVDICLVCMQVKFTFRYLVTGIDFLTFSCMFWYKHKNIDVDTVIPDCMIFHLFLKLAQISYGWYHIGLRIII